MPVTTTSFWKVTNTDGEEEVYEDMTMGKADGISCQHMGRHNHSYM